MGTRMRVMRLAMAGAAASVLCTAAASVPATASPTLPGGTLMAVSYTHLTLPTNREV